MYIDVDVRICSDLIPLVSWSLDKYLVIFISAMFHVKKMSYTYLSVVDPTALRAHRSRSDFFFSEQLHASHLGDPWKRVTLWSIRVQIRPRVLLSRSTGLFHQTQMLLPEGSMTKRSPPYSPSWWSLKVKFCRGSQVIGLSSGRSLSWSEATCH